MNLLNAIILSAMVVVLMCGLVACLQHFNCLDRAFYWAVGQRRRSPFQDNPLPRRYQQRQQLQQHSRYAGQSSTLV